MIVAPDLEAIIREKALCCRCLRSLRFELEISAIIIPHKLALWEAPVAYADGKRYPIALLCRDCLSLGHAPILAVEFGSGFYCRYYAVEGLPDDEEKGARLREDARPE